MDALYPEGRRPPAPIDVHWRHSKMKRRFGTKSIVIVMALGVLTGGALTGFALASGDAGARSQTPALTIDPLEGVVYNSGVVMYDSSKYEVDAGGSVAGSAACPKSVSQKRGKTFWYVVGGGYVIGGSVGDAIASATASYPTTDSNSWHVVVSNPKLASTAVSFLVRAACLYVKEGPVGGG
jgi:hypothetical protein